jgi:hypothetical protein
VKFFNVNIFNVAEVLKVIDRLPFVIQMAWADLTLLLQVICKTGKNEDIRKIKLLMQQSLSHGAPSPKLSKMVEVLVDHFSEWHPLS